VANVMKGTNVNSVFTIPAAFTPIAIKSSAHRTITGKQLAIGAALVTSALLLKGAAGRLIPQALARVPVY
jgi:hypothetical protein